MCRPLIEEKRQRFQVSMGQVRHVNVMADGDRLRQVLMNLLSNAIKYTQEEGTISLRINELYSSLRGRRQYEFICIDNGIGISKDFIPCIFEPFSRAEDHRISRLQGTGLGMTITENIVRMMNGTIQVESELGRGSRFTVSIPLEYCREENVSNGALRDLSAQGPYPSTSKGGAGAVDAVPEEKGRTLAGSRVLLAEDNDINREIAVELLEMQDIVVDAVENGLRALEVFEASAPGGYRAILMDIQMPVMNGYDAAVRIRALNRRDAQTIPIIALTADAFTTDVAKARSAGMNDHIAKPIEMKRLLQVLEKCIKG